MSNKSYRRYREYKANQYQYKMDNIAFLIVVLFIIGILGDAFFPVLIGSAVIMIVRIFRKNPTPKDTTAENLESTVPRQREAETPRVQTICYITDEEIVTPESEVEKPMSKTHGLKSTETGYINDNDQKNNGRSNEKGTDHGQWFYHMECLKCGHKYFANGTDIWQRKCPKCQGGKP